MKSLSFDSMLNQILQWWPEEFVGKEDDFLDPMRSSSISKFYESNVEPISQASNSRLLIQLDWIFYSIMEELSRRAIKINTRDIRKSLLRSRFENLIQDIALPQLRGDSDWDNSFDREELIDYIKIQNEVDL